MQFVEDHALERAEQIRRIGRGQQQRELLRRGQQDLRRIAALALALRGRRVAGARLDADRQPHFGDRRFQIARDIDGERLERRDVERVQSALAPHAAAGGDRAAASPHRCARGGELKRRSTPPGSAEIRRASCRRRSARSAAPSGRRAPWPKVPTGARAASSRGWRTSARTVQARSSCVRERSRARTSGRWRRGRGLRDHDEAVDRHAFLGAHRRFGEMRRP